MNRIKIYITLILIFSFICPFVYANDTKSYSYKATVDFETGESTIEEELTGNMDYSSLMVNVTKTSSGVTSNVYTGTLGKYENGIWSNVDFSDIQGLLLFDWETEDTIWIEPVVANSTTNATSEKIDTVTQTNQTPSLMAVSPDLAVTSNIKLNGIAVGENGMRIIDNANVSCTLGVSNSSTKDDSITAILATYTSEGRLNNIKTFILNITEYKIRSRDSFDVKEFAKDYWSIDTGYEQSEDINVQIEKIYNKIKAKTMEINEIKDLFCGEVGFVITVKQENEGILPAIYFESEFVKFAATIGADINVDFT